MSYIPIFYLYNALQYTNIQRNFTHITSLNPYYIPWLVGVGGGVVWGGGHYAQLKVYNKLGLKPSFPDSRAGFLFNLL